MSIASNSHRFSAQRGGGPPSSLIYIKTKLALGTPPPFTQFFCGYYCSKTARSPPLPTFCIFFIFGGDPRSFFHFWGGPVKFLPPRPPKSSESLQIIDFDAFWRPRQGKMGPPELPRLNARSTIADTVAKGCLSEPHHIGVLSMPPPQIPIHEAKCPIAGRGPKSRQTLIFPRFSTKWGRRSSLDKDLRNGKNFKHRSQEAHVCKEPPKTRVFSGGSRPDPRFTWPFHRRNSPLAGILSRAERLGLSGTFSP